MKSLFAAAALTIACATPILADEVWSTSFGDIIYEKDIDNYIAVFSIPAEAVSFNATPGSRARIYIPGFTNSGGARGYHEAFWTVPGSTACEATLAGPDGLATDDWGRATLLFDAADFPSGFTMLVGTCFYDPTFMIRAEPVVGQ